MSNSWMTETEIREKFAEIVSQSLKIDVEQVSPEAYLDDLGAESLDLIEIAMEVESQVQVWLPEKSILQTAIDVYGPGVLEKDGYLTEEGKALFQARLPAEDAARFEGTFRLKDVNRYFMQVETWVHMIDGLLVYTPDGLRPCGGAAGSVARISSEMFGLRRRKFRCGPATTLTASGCSSLPRAAGISIRLRSQA